MQVMCIVLCKLSLWDYASYEHDVMQVMYMLKWHDMQVMHAYASMWMLMQVCGCLCKYVNAYASCVYA